MQNLPACSLRKILLLITANFWEDYPASYSFSFGEGIRLEVKKFRNAVKLLNLLGKSEKKVVAEIVFDSSPKLEFKVGCNDQEFDFSKEIKALDNAVKIISDFEINDLVDISFDEITRYGTQICQMQEVLSSSPRLLKIEFGVDGGGYDSSEQTACILLVTTPIGSHIFGVILVVTGDVEEIEGGRYRLIAKNVVVEQRIVSEKDELISIEDIVAAIESIEEQYDNDFSVVTMFDKSAFKSM